MPRLPKKILSDYYKSAYQAVREIVPDDKAVIISDGFRPKKWENELTGEDYKNVWLDMHLYQCFDKADKNLKIEGHIDKTKRAQAKLIESVRKKRPVIIGEWSLGLDPKTFDNMTDIEQAKAIRAYAKAQIETYSSTNGWFFWTYKTQEQGAWNFRHCVDVGLLPNSY